MQRSSPSRKLIATALFAGLAAGACFAYLACQTSPILGVGLLLSLVGVGAVVVNPFFGFLLTSGAVPLERIGRLTNDSSMYTFSIMRAMGLLSLGALLLHLCLRKQRFWYPYPVVLYSIYLLIAGLTLVHTQDFEMGVRGFSSMIANLAFFILVVNILKSPKQINHAIICWLFVTMAIGAYTIYQWHFTDTAKSSISEEKFNSRGERSTEQRFSTILLDDSEYETLGLKVRRALGSSSAPAVYAINVILSLPFYFYIASTQKNRWVLAMSLAGIAIGCYNVVLTNTRAAVLTLAFTLLVISVIGLVRWRASYVVAAILATVAAVPLLPDSVYERVFSASSYSTAKSKTLAARLIYWRAAVDIFEDNWLVGMGVANQAELPKRVTSIPMPPNSSIHNEYIGTLLETGIIGYVVMVSFMVTLYRRCRFAERAFRRDANREMVLMTLAIRVAFISVLFYGVQVDVMHFPLKGWWLSMGIAVVLYDMVKKKAAAQIPAELTARAQAA